MEQMVSRMNHVERQIQVLGKNWFTNREELEALDWQYVWPVVTEGGYIVDVTDGEDVDEAEYSEENDCYILR